MRGSKSELHNYMKRRKSNARIEREALEGFIAERLNLRKGCYGYRLIDRELKRDSIVVSEKRMLTVIRKLVNGTGRKMREKAKQNTFKHIELYCNRRRMHSSIRHNAPCDLERYVARKNSYFRPRNLGHSTSQHLIGTEFYQHPLPLCCLPIPSTSKSMIDCD